MMPSVSTSPRPIVVATAVPIRAPIEIARRCHHDGLPRRQDPRRHDRSDRVRRVIEAVDVLEEQPEQDDAQYQGHRRHFPLQGSEVLSRTDLEDHVSRVAAAVDDLLQHLEQIAEHDHLQGVVLAAVKLPHQREHELVGIAFVMMQAVVGSLNDLQSRFAELPNHLVESIGCLLQQHGLLPEKLRLEMRPQQKQALGKLLEHLGNPRQGAGQRVDVLAIEGRDERVADHAADLFADPFILFAELDELVQRVTVLGSLDKFANGPGRTPCFVGAGLQKFEEPIASTKDALQREHKHSAPNRGKYVQVMDHSYRQLIKS